MATIASEFSRSTRVISPTFSEYGEAPRRVDDRSNHCNRSVRGPHPHVPVHRSCLQPNERPKSCADRQRSSEETEVRSSRSFRSDARHQVLRSWRPSDFSKDEQQDSDQDHTQSARHSKEEKWQPHEQRGGRESCDYQQPGNGLEFRGFGLVERWPGRLWCGWHRPAVPADGGSSPCCVGR
jgi:hypothetical protein